MTHTKNVCIFNDKMKAHPIRCYFMIKDFIYFLEIEFMVDMTVYNKDLYHHGITETLKLVMCLKSMESI